MKYVSVTSGICAATVAWMPLGFAPVCFSEIAKFPSAVLEHHYPSVKNNGDIATFRDWGIMCGSVDVLVGGTPCQDVSQGGLQAGWNAARSGLAWQFIGLAEHILPRFVVWENVPNCMQGKHKPGFLRFIWELNNLGYCVSWRVLNARYFGVAQQRRRIFVVASLGNDCSRKILLESNGKEGVDSSPRPSPVSVCLTARGAGSLDDRETYVADRRGIRHLTPLENERLMGFPDNFTLIKYRGKDASDGPRSKALGNSIAVPILAWLGARIKAEAT